MKLIKSTIGIILFLIGLAVFYDSVCKMTLKYFTSASWQQVPASISLLRPKNNSGKSYTRYVVVHYEYHFRGIKYQSHSVTLSDVDDNFGSFWSDLYKRLEQEKVSDSVKAWINPNNPSDALLDRTFRWSNVFFGIIFLFMLCGFGFMLIWKSNKMEKRRGRNG